MNGKNATGFNVVSSFGGKQCLCQKAPTVRKILFFLQVVTIEWREAEVWLSAVGEWLSLLLWYHATNVVSYHGPV
jgi:hypothetical protein